MSEKEVKQELTEMEVNIYARGCGDPRMGCLFDCINLSAWLSTDLQYGGRKS